MSDATTHNSSRTNSNHPTIDCTMDLQSSNKNDVFFKGLINTKPTLASPILEPKPYLALMAVRLHWTIGFLSPLYLRCNLMAVELIQRPDKWSFTLAIFNKTLFDNAQEAFLMNSLFRLPYGVSSTSEEFMYDAKCLVNLAAICLTGNNDTLEVVSVVDNTFTVINWDLLGLVV